MFIDVVKKSQIFNDSDPNIKIGPHQMRKLACSYNKKYFPKHGKTICEIRFKIYEGVE